MQLSHSLPQDEKKTASEQDIPSLIHDLDTCFISTHLHLPATFIFLPAKNITLETFSQQRVCLSLTC